MTKSNLREKAQVLRAEGNSIPKIAERLNIAKSTVSVWVRDVKLTPYQKGELKKQGIEKTQEALRKRKREVTQVSPIKVEYSDSRPKVIGERTEAIILAALLRKGETLLLPFGDNQRYDLVLDRDGTFIRVQCKTGRLRNGGITFHASSSHEHRGNGRRKYVGEADFFGIYCPELDKVYLLPVKDVFSKTLRVDPPLNGQKTGICWAKDYEV